MRRREDNLVKTAIALACAVLLMASAAAASSRFDGTWKTETKSAKLPDKPDVFLLQNGTYTCKSCVPSFSIKADGVPHSLIGNPYFDAVAMTVIDTDTFRVDHMKGGTVISRGTMRISSDGRTLADDFSHRNGANAAIVTGHLTARRVATGPSGSATLSGAWQITSLSEADIDRTFTFTTTGTMLLMSRPSGQSFDARLSGEEAVYLGDPGLTGVRVKRLAADTIEETDLRNNVVVGVTTMTVAAGGKMLTSVHLDTLHGFKTASIAYRQ